MNKKFWPRSWHDYTEKELLELDDKAFRQLRTLLREREFAATKSRRRAREIARKITVARKRAARRYIPKRMFKHSRKDSIILDTFVKGRENKWIHPFQRRKRCDLSLEKFSFIDNPVESMDKLYEIARSECWAADGELHFDDERVLDIGPYLVLGLMTEAMAPYTAGGRIHPPVQKVIEVVELRKALEMGKFRGLRDLRDVWGFPLRRRRAPGKSVADNLATRETTKEKVAENLIEAINDWLCQRKQPLELSEDGEWWLTSIVGEVLDNAERHGQQRGDGDWATAGFMAKRATSGAGQNESTRYICHLGFVNVGLSISESITTGYDHLTQDIEKYVERHRNTFLQNRKFEALSTLYALQDGISRIPQDDNASKGGVGMMDLVEFVNELSRDVADHVPPEICVISGHTCIQFKTPFNKFIKKGVDEPRVQWFNDSQRADVRPNRKHVFTLAHRFPGTIISLRFCLGEEAVSEAEELHGER